MRPAGREGAAALVVEASMPKGVDVPPPAMSGPGNDVPVEPLRPTGGSQWMVLVGGFSGHLSDLPEPPEPPEPDVEEEALETSPLPPPKPQAQGSSASGSGV